MNPSSTNEAPEPASAPSPVTLPDGRVVEWVSGSWAEPEPGDPDPGEALPANITVSINGEIQTVRIFLTNEQLREAFRGSD